MESIEVRYLYCSDEFAERIAVRLPPHDRQILMGRSASAPEGIWIVSESLTWLLPTASVLVIARALGLTSFTSSFATKLGEQFAEIAKDLIWDEKKKTFSGLHDRVRKAILGPEPSVGELVIRELFRELDDARYLMVGLPLPSPRAPMRMTVCRTDADEVEDGFDRLAMTILLEDALQSAAKVVADKYPDLRNSGLQVQFERTEIVMTWCEPGSGELMRQRFDLSGSPLDDPYVFG